MVKSAAFTQVMVEAENTHTKSSRQPQHEESTSTRRLHLRPLWDLIRQPVEDYSRSHLRLKR
jgi:hypothetical protein